jgi:cytochrome c5
MLWRIANDAISSEAALAVYEDEHGHRFHSAWHTGSGKKWITTCCDLCHAFGVARKKP